MNSSTAQLEKKISKTRTLNLWALVISWIQFANLIISNVFFVLNFDYENPLAIFTNPFFVISFLIQLSQIIFFIFVAVFNNNYQIKKLYQIKDVYSIPTMAVLQVFFFPYIFATIIWVQTKNILKPEYTTAIQVINSEKKATTKPEDKQNLLKQLVEIVERKKKRNRILNAWVMWVNILAAIGMQTGSVFFAVLAIISILAALVLNVLSAVFNNDKTIKALSKKTKKGELAPILSIVMAVITYLFILGSWIFIVTAILAVIIWINTLDLLKLSDRK